MPYKLNAKIRNALEGIPWVTGSLVGFMMIAFGLIQYEMPWQKTAHELFFKSPLSKIELPAYVRFVQSNMFQEHYLNIMEAHNRATLSSEELYWLALTDPNFQNSLAQYQVITKSDPRFETWKTLRNPFEKAFAHNLTVHWGFKTAEPTLMSALAAPFMHSRLDHFVINTLLLIAVGTYLECTLGAGLLIGLVALIHAVGLSMLSFVHPFSLVPIIGAQGLISGLMSFLISLMVISKEHLVGELRFKNRRISIPLALIPAAWLLWQLVDWNVYPAPLSEYAVEGGGVIAGVLLGALYTFRKSKSQTADVQTKDYENFKHRFDEATQAIIDFNYPLAKKILFELLEVDPNHHEVLFALFNVTKLQPSSEDYHKIVHHIFVLRDNSRSWVSMTNIVFTNYLKRAEPTIRYEPQVFLGLQQKFRKYHYLEDAEKILKILAQNNRAEKMNEILAYELLQLAKAYHHKQDDLKAKMCLDMCRNSYPDTASAKEARSMQLAYG